uniref:Endonuclease/exonuclease/phosphatase domain-containing protein n=1 Tax=Fagus sylvatica TaxID=28930 RepID=A0A2N9FAE5_FAGSY
MAFTGESLAFMVTLRRLSVLVLRLYCSILVTLVTFLGWMGDFNEITQLEEKSGREDRNVNQIQGFREVLLDCSLQDLGFVGGEFTWSNKRDHQALVRAHLDRGVATGMWRQMFTSASIRHLVVSSSDHMGLLMDTTSGPVVQPGNRRRK